jgi:hypothetical protein
MTLVDLDSLDIENAPEPTVVDADEEYKLVIISVTTGVDKNDFDYILPRLEVEDNPLAKDFTYFVHLPTDGMTEKKLLKVTYQLKMFLKCFGVSTTGKLNPEEDLPGRDGWAILGVDEDEQYGEQNYVKRLIVPK